MRDLKIKKPTSKSGFVGILKVPIYHTHIQFYGTREDMALDIPNAEDIIGRDYGAVTFWAGSDKTGDWLNVAFSSPVYMHPEVIAHEATHAAWFILQQVGVKVTFANHEQLAYLVGYITDQLTQFVDAYKQHHAEPEITAGERSCNTN